MFYRCNRYCIRCIHGYRDQSGYQRCNHRILFELFFSVDIQADVLFQQTCPYRRSDAFLPCIYHEVLWYWFYEMKWFLFGCSIFSQWTIVLDQDRYLPFPVRHEWWIKTLFSVESYLPVVSIVWYSDIGVNLHLVSVDAFVYVNVQSNHSFWDEAAVCNLQVLIKRESNDIYLFP